MSVKKIVAALSVAAGLIVVSPTTAVASTVVSERSVNHVSVARGTTLQDCNIQRSVLRAQLANERRTIVSDTGCQKIKNASPGGIQYQSRVVWR